MFFNRRNCLSICHRFRQLSTALNDLVVGDSSGEGRCGSQMMAAAEVSVQAGMAKARLTDTEDGPPHATAADGYSQSPGVFAS